MYDRLPYLRQNQLTDTFTDSSGISVTNRTEDTEFESISAKDRLKFIARQHNQTRRSSKVQQDIPYQEHDNSYLPRINVSPKTVEKEKAIMKSDFRLSSLPKNQLPKLPAAPPTVGKYRHRVKIIPTLNLPSPDSKVTSSPPPATHFLLKEQFRKERNQQSPGFSESDLARIFDHYSLSRYLASPESRPNTSRNTPSRSLCFKTNKSLASLKTNEIKKTLPSIGKNKSSRLLWVPRLASWIPEEQNHRIQYLKFGHGANLNIKRRAVCCGHHDYFHRNLNWDTREWIPTVCPRYSYHHHHHHQRLQIPKKKPVLSHLNGGFERKRKPSTIPRDPFTSKEKRNIKRPWLNEPKPLKVPELEKQSVHLVLPSENDDAYAHHWMIDNSTMTEDSSSDVFSIPTTIHIKTPPSVQASKQPLRVQKKRKIKMFDKACDVMTPTSVSSRGHSYYTEDTENKDFEDGLEDIPLFTETEGDSPINLEEKLVRIETAKKSARADENIAHNLLNEEDSMIALEYAEHSELPETNSAACLFDVLEVNSHSTDLFGDKTSASDIASDTDKESTVDSYFPIIASDSEESCQTSNEGNKFKESSTSVSELKQKLRAKPPPPRIISPIKKQKPEPLTNDDSNRSRKTTTSKKRDAIVIPVPKLLDRQNSTKSSKSGRTKISIHTPSPTSSRRRGKITRDTTIADEMRRAKLAEERKKRAREKFDKLKESRAIPASLETPSPIDSLDNGDLLNNFSIINPNKVDIYRRAFNSIDMDEDGYLDCEELLIAIQKILPNDLLKESQLNHIHTLLDLVNHNILSDKTNFTMFSVIASLAQKIVALDDFMKGLIDRFDFQSLDAKTWKARQLFNHYVDDPEAQTISMESLWIELKAGGIAKHNEKKIRESLKHLPHLNVLDFMTYLPLFTFTYSYALNNPLCEEC